MPHILELATQAQIDALYRANIAQISTKIIFNVDALQQTGTQPGGAPIFGTTYQNVTFEVSDRAEDSGISISLEKPAYPSDTLNTITAGEIQVKLLNPDTYWAVTQDNAIIDTQSIEQGEVWILADVGAPDQIPVFYGRITGPPTEERGRVIFKVRDTMYDAIRKPILYENYGLVGGVVQSAAVTDEGNLIAQPVEIATAYGSFCAYHGLIRFNGSGNPAVNVTNSKPDQIKIRFINLLNGAKPGNYAIRFDTDTNYTLIYPDNSEYSGTVANSLTTPYVVIPQSAWEGIEADVFGQTVEVFNGQDCEINIQLYYAVKGNPIAIIVNLLEKALEGNIGDIPGLVPSVKLDFPAFSAIAPKFIDAKVFVSITNENNQVWEEKTGSRPVNYLDVAQQVADHVGCFIVLQPDGTITIKGPWMDSDTIHEIDTLQAVTDHKINGVSKRFNIVRLQYGFDEINNSYGGLLEKDFRTDPTSEPVYINILAPYYKVGVSDQQAQWLLDLFVRKYTGKQVTISCEITPNFALPALPGDRIRFISRQQPIIDTYAEIQSVGKTIGRTGKFNLVLIADPEGDPFNLCTAEIDGEELF